MKKNLTLIIIIFICSISSFSQDAASYTKTGDKAPVFTCKTLDGKIIDISKLKGKVILVNFFATWCPPCNQELPVLQEKVWDKYRNNDDFVLVILGREHTQDELKKWVDTKGFRMPFAADPKREIFSLYAKETIPRTVIIDKEGRIAFQSIGYTPEDFRALEEKLAEMLK